MTPEMLSYVLSQANQPAAGAMDLSINSGPSPSPHQALSDAMLNQNLPVFPSMVPGGLQQPSINVQRK